MPSNRLLGLIAEVFSNEQNAKNFMTDPAIGSTAYFANYEIDLLLQYVIIRAGQDGKASGNGPAGVDPTDRIFLWNIIWEDIINNYDFPNAANFETRLTTELARFCQLNQTTITAIQHVANAAQIANVNPAARDTILNTIWQGTDTHWLKCW